jgi:hypothetical protein
MESGVDPNVPVVKCAVCGKDVHTCERKEAVDEDYTCPVHRDGCELTDGRCVCSYEGWELAVESELD